jgi:peptidoglycan/xylan/chitin deacetylase (PgdA/CDA1 family)
VDHFTTPPGRLQRHLDLLVRGYRPITPAMLLAAIRQGTPLPERAVLLTFDDSSAEHLEHAYPILRARGLEALLFIPTGLVREPGHDPAGYPEDAGLDWAQLRRMRDVFTIGSHGVSHQAMTVLPRADAAAEITDSKRVLEERLGEPVWSFAYPYGSHGAFDDELEVVVRSAGYAASFTTVPGPITAGQLRSGSALRRQGAEPLSRLALGRVLDGSCDLVQGAVAERRARAVRSPVTG